MLFRSRNCLPPCSATTIGTDVPSIFPNPPVTEVPLWLQKEIKKVANNKSLRDWTCILSDRCAATGDVQLADVMMDIPIIQLESYLANVLQLAFLPDSFDDNSTSHIVQIVRYPRGFSKNPLSRQLFDRLVVVFEKSCEDLNVKYDNKNDLVEKLRCFRKSFPKSNTSPPVHEGNSPKPILVDDNPELILITVADTNASSEENEKKNLTKRFSLSRKASLSNYLHSMVSISSTPKKWFRTRKSSEGIKVTI